MGDYFRPFLAAALFILVACGSPDQQQPHAEDDAIVCIVRGNGNIERAALWSVDQSKGDRRCDEQ